MRTFLLTWNPERYPQLRTQWSSDRQLIAAHGAVPGAWATGHRLDVTPGDRAYLLRQGVEPRGVVAAGEITSPVFQEPHWDDSGRFANYVEVSWDAMVDLDDPLPVDVLQSQVPEVHWGTQASGIQVTDHAAEIDELWAQHTGLNGPSRAWLAISVLDRARAVNDGYDDDPARHYSWDSTVPNATAIRSGDAIVLWDKHTLLGASVIDAIDTGTATKPVYRCRECGGSNIKARKTKAPRYLCFDCHAEFDVPITRTQDVTTYRSRHERAWVDLGGALDAAELRALCEKPGSQLSLRPLRWQPFLDAVARAGFGRPLSPAPAAAVALPGGHTERTVRVRKGQGGFRKHLLDTYGEVCAFTGPCPAPALEAAHLYSYAAKAEHHVKGGLLLRRDLHRLFDLGLVAVDPDGLTVDVAENLRGYPLYGDVHRQPLQISLTAAQLGWVSQHWAQHRRRTSIAGVVSDYGDAAMAPRRPVPRRRVLSPPSRTGRAGG